MYFKMMTLDELLNIDVYSLTTKEMLDYTYSLQQKMGEEWEEIQDEIDELKAKLKGEKHES